MIPSKIDYKKEELQKIISLKLLELNNLLRTVKETQFEIRFNQSVEQNRLLNAILLEKTSLFPMEKNYTLE